MVYVNLNLKIKRNANVKVCLFWTSNTVRLLEYDYNLTKRCPECDCFIEKYGGCDRMKCLCGCIFDWKTISIIHSRDNIFLDSIDSKIDSNILSEHSVYSAF